LDENRSESSEASPYKKGAAQPAADYLVCKNRKNMGLSLTGRTGKIPRIPRKSTNLTNCFGNPLFRIDITVEDGRSDG
jgi:hypothetical protein